MEIEFGDSDLDRLEIDARFDAGFPQGVVRAYRKRINMIRAAPNELIFRKSKGLHYEKLKGKRRNQSSMRLNKQFRLILKIVERNGQKIVIVLSIEDYH
jgi:proteic killer suppression protein